MKQSLLKFLTFLVLSLSVIAVPTLADTINLAPVGAPFVIGSWAQRFQENGVGNYNRFQVYMITPGVSFEAPGMGGFSVGGWSATLINPGYILASGTTITDSQFDIHFLPAMSTPFVFDFTAWDGNILRETARATWNGSTWTIGASPVSYPPVPEPATLVLFASGLAGLWLRRRAT